MRDEELSDEELWDKYHGPDAVEAVVPHLSNFRLTWFDGNVEEVTAATIDEAICICQKGPPATWCIHNDKLNDEDIRSNVLFGAFVVRTEGFRSVPKVNTDEDMVRVTLDMPKHTWHKLQKQIQPNKEVNRE